MIDLIFRFRDKYSYRVQGTRYGIRIEYLRQGVTLMIIQSMVQGTSS